MKKLLEVLIVCAMALGIAAGCKTEPGGGGDPTPVPATPVPTAEPVPTEVPTPVPVKPCVLHSTIGGNNVYKGDCAASETCRDGGDGFFYGPDCKQKETP